ncbi:MAG: GxxExxY protein [Gallionella sp.]|nr:GxxExxY protein [Gallionella sp.]
MMEHSEVTQKIIGCAMKVHGTLGSGFLESVYQNALALELHKAGMKVECEKRIQVTYDGVVVGDFVADMLINENILVENKAVQVLVSAHEVQLVNYLTATGTDIGLLLNFGAARLEFKRKTRTFCPKKSGQDEQDFQDKAQAPFASYPVHPVNPVEASKCTGDQ